MAVNILIYIVTALDARYILIYNLLTYLGSALSSCRRVSDMRALSFQTRSRLPYGGWDARQAGGVNLGFRVYGLGFRV